MTNDSTSQTPSPDPDAQMMDLAEVEDAKLASKDQSYSQGELVRRRFFSHIPAMISLVGLVFVSIIAFSSMGFGFIPGWWSEPYRLQPGATVVNGGQPTFMQDGQFLGPHPFGQDSLPRDFFARVMRGVQQSIIIGLVVAVVASIIGILVGAAAGYFRGWVEAVLMRITDFVIVVPLLVIAAILGQMVRELPFAPFPLAVVLGCVLWTGMARLVRAEVLALREKEYVSAAIAMGSSPWRIIARHMLPNSIGVIIVNASFMVGSAILLESILSFLGMGVQPPEVSLGMLISQGEVAFNTRPFLFWLPGLFIVFIVLCINFIGDGLRDAFDPRQQRSGDRRPGMLAALGFRGMTRLSQRQAEDTRSAATGGTSGGTTVPGSHEPRSNVLFFWRKK